MRSKPKSRTATLSTLLAAACLTFFSFQASSEDIDIFSVDEDNLVARPNVLIVLDNSANWARQAQHWPELTVDGKDEQQGQSESAAIKAVLKELDDSINVGLMEYIAGGSAADQDSGYIRFHIRPMNDTNKDALGVQLDKIYNDVNTPDEKRPQSNPFGTLFWDVYNYLAGINASNLSGGIVKSLADVAGYSNLYDTFQSPLTSADTCTRTVVIFIGNNVSSGPSADSSTNEKALYNIASGGTWDSAGSDTDAGDDAIEQIPFADYAITTRNATSRLGYTNKCYTTATACSSAENTTACSTDQGFVSCSCDATDFQACPSTHWNVVGTNSTTSTAVTSDTTDGPTSNVSTNDIVQTCITTGAANGLNPTTCPANSDITVDNGNGQTTETITTWAANSCAYAKTTDCTSSRANYEKKGTRTQRIIVRQTTTTTTTTTLPGETAACYNDLVSCSTTGFNCSAYNQGCACNAATSTTGCGAGNTSRYQLLGNYTVTGATQLSTFHAAPSGPFMLDEWARFLRQVGVTIPGGGAKTQVTTYTIDVFNEQQHPDFSALLFNAARVGGGKYFQAKDKNSLINALKQIFTEVQAVNSAFSSASLPVNATNRAQNENQVFIGVFKPDRTKRPLWFGNLKRFQLISSGSTIDLGDSLGARAINTQTGFITDCAVSFWTVDSTFNDVPYWKVSRYADPLPIGGCTTNKTDDLSDLPDGPFVEKGAVAEVVRRGNDPTATPDTDGNFDVNRTIYTRTSSTAAGATPPLFTVADFGSSSTSGLDDDTVKYIRGEDVLDEDFDGLVTKAQTEPRQTIHGDVVHSRPQPLNFGGSTGVVVFYGSNDGHYRAVQATTGQELWSFVAPEHYNKLSRLLKNDPIIYYPGGDPLGSNPKDYFFDGSTGVYQTFNSDGTSNKAWVYPSMRRGGRMLYALDVSTPSKPKYMWAKGCDQAAVCSSGFSSIGQTWALPNLGFIKGYSTTKPVVVMGGGYDTCDDQDTASPCPAARGRGVYVLDAETGAVVRYFDFSTLSGVSARGVAADVSLIDIDNDKNVDYAYAADTGGNIYRMDFIDGPVTKTALTDATTWRMSRVAYTNGGARKFLFTPALLQATSNIIYLAIGTGDREHPLMSQYAFGTDGDPSSAVLNRFYVFKDSLTDVDSTTSTDMDSSTDMADYTTGANCATTPITPSASKKGWYINLNEHGQGEQVVTSAVIAAGFVFFSTNRPTPSSTTACTNSLGEARGYFVNLLTASGAVGVSGACGGTRSSTFVGGGLPPSPVLATVPIDGQLRTVVIGAVQKTGEPSSPIEAQRVRPPIASDRKPIYWFKSTGDK